jgi:putative hemolysin
MRGTHVLRIETMVDQTMPWLAQLPWLKRPVLSALARIADEAHFNLTLQQLRDAQGLAFVARALALLRAGIVPSHDPAGVVPTHGPLLVVANHPQGMLDALALLHAIGQVRGDVKVLGNAVLLAFPQLQELVLPVPVFGGRASARAVLRTLERGEVVLLFPAGEVSRVRATGVRDRRWSGGFVRLARLTGASVLPAHVSARNSMMFYGVSMLLPPLAPAMLPREALGRAHARIGLRFGEVLPARALPQAMSAQALASRMRRHVYRLGRGAPALFKGLSPLVPAPPAHAVAAALQARGEVLIEFGDGKQIVLLPGALDCPAMREIGRLRELSFRAVGEGSGRACDLDRHDAHYEQLVLWDACVGRIAGAYRLGQAGPICARYGRQALYSATLFEFTPAAAPYLAAAVELGRSFVAPDYWRSRALDQLWRGIGAYLRRHPEIRWLLGPVSLSASLPTAARDLVVATYRHLFGQAGLARGSHRHAVSAGIADRVADAARGRSHEACLQWLRAELAPCGGLPVLYRQYADLVSPDGLKLLDFSEDPDFSSCIDGLFLVDLQQMRPEKRARYLSPGAAAGAGDPGRSAPH